MNIEQEFRFSNDNTRVRVSIKKISIKPGVDSMVLPGDEFVGFLYPTSFGGLRVMCPDGPFGGNTSQMCKIVNKTDNVVIFETTTSVYQLVYT